MVERKRGRFKVKTPKAENQKSSIPSLSQWGGLFCATMRENPNYCRYWLEKVIDFQQ
jgi:hypothetical protein